MFLVQAQIDDGRLFYAYITGHEARLVKNWISLPGSLPNNLCLQGLPTMSFCLRQGLNYCAAKWTTSTVKLFKEQATTHIQLPNGNKGTVFADPQLIRTVLVTVQDNPLYSCDGFDANYRPNIAVQTIRNRDTVFRWVPGTIIQLLPVEGYPTGPTGMPIIDLTGADKGGKRKDDDQDPGNKPKRQRLGRPRRNTAA